MEQDIKVIEKINKKLAEETHKKGNTRNKNNTGSYGYRRVKISKGKYKGWYELYHYYRFPKQPREKSPHEVSVVYYDKNGVLNRGYSKELEKKIKEHKEQTTVKSVDSQSLFIDYCKNWLKDKRRNITPAVYDNYETIINKQIEPYSISNCRCSNLQDYIIEDYLKEVAKDYSKGTVDKVYNDVVKPAIKYGMKRKHIPYIDLEDIEKPKTYKTGKRGIPVLSEEQYKLLYQEICKLNTKDKNILIFIMQAGLRVEEACSLKWVDVDKEYNSFTIQRSTQDSKKRDKNGNVIKDKDGKAVHIKTEKNPKTETSIRTISTNANLKAILRELSKEKHNDKDYVFRNGNGNKYDRNNVRRTLNRIIKQLDIKTTLHGLRHTFATLGVNNPNISNKSIQYTLGHSDIRTTMNVYSDTTQEANQETMDYFNSLLPDLQEKSEQL